MLVAKSIINHILSKTYLSVVFVLLVSASSFGQTLSLSDDFTSSNATALTAASPAWTQASAGVNTIKIARADSSGFITFAGYTGSGTGNAVLLKPTGQDVYRTFTAVTNGSTIYAAFILNVTSTQTGDFFFSFNNGASTFGGRLFIKTNGAGYNLGMQIGTTANASYGSSVYSLNTNYLVVAKYQLITGAANDIASLFVFPAGTIPSIESTPIATAPLSTEVYTAAGITGVLLRQGAALQGSTQLIDGIRVSTDWATAVNSNVNSAPVLSTPIGSLITSSSATLGASLTSYGWNSSVGNDATVTERGIVWSTSPSPTTANNKVSGGTGINFSVSATGLPSGTKIYYRGYAINASGTSYTSDGFIYTEPASHVSNFAGSVTNSSTVDLTWTPVADAAGYLILSKVGGVPSGLPTDGSLYTAGNTIGDATVRAVVSNGSATGVTVSGLTAADHYFEVIPFGYDGSNVSTYNYKIDGTIPSTFQSTILGSSDLVATTGFVYPANIDYANLQSTDITFSNSAAVMGLTIRDGGSTLTDADATPTTLTGLTLSVTNPSQLRKAALYDGSTELEEVTVSGSPIVFSTFTASAADGGTKNLTLRVTYQSTVTDNTQNQFTVIDVNSQAGNSGFAAADGGGAVSSITGDNNRIEVTASQLTYFSQPANNSTFYSGSVWGTPIVVHAKDANSNLDLDYSAFVTLNPNGSGILTGNSVSASAGVTTFNSLNHNTTETIQLTASSGGLTTALSNSFIVLSPLQTLGVLETFNSTPTNFDNTWTFTQGTSVTTAITAPNSSGYSGASGGRYVSFGATLGQIRTLTIGGAIGIDTRNLTNLNVSFGYYQAAALASSGVTTIEWSTDGVTFNPISLSGLLPSPLGWALISNVALPSGAVTANLRLRFKVDYSVNTGAIRIDDIKLQGSSSFASEPTVVSSGLNFTNIGNVSFDANWTNGNGQKRLVLAKSGAPVDASPVDGTTYSANSVFGTGSQIGTGNYVVYNGTGNTVPLTGLTQGQNYQFAVYDFNGSGSTANYLTTGVPTGSQTTVNASFASFSNAYIQTGTESDSISSIINNASPLASTDGAKVFDVFIQDGNGTNDFDILATIVDSLKFTAGSQNEVSDWKSVIKTAALFNGTTLLAEATVGQNSLTFKPSTPISIADNGSKTLTVRLSLKNSGIVDNQKIQFSLASSGIYAGTSGSQFGSVSTTETIGSKNKIYVQATKIRFASQPTLTKVGNSVTPALTVEVTDANLNKALRYNSSVNLTSNTAFDGASVNSGSFNSGTATFNSVKLGATNAQVVLYANSGSLTSAVSDTFTVYNLASEPTVAASNLQFSTVGNTSVDLSWTNGNGAKRIVVAKSGAAVNANILDETTYTANSVFGSGSQIDTGNYVIYSGTGNSVSVTGLSQNQTYHFAVYEFSGTGISTNYLTSSVLTGSQTTLNVSYASLSTAYLVNGTESDSISSIVNNASPLASTDGAKVFDVFIQDGNGINDFDSLPTIVDSLKFTAGAQNEVSDLSSIIKTAALFDGTTLLAEAIVGQNSITFKPSSPISIADNDSKTLTVRLSLKNTGIVDNQKIQFSLASSGIYAGTSGSQFGSVSTTETNSNKNKIYVQATKIRFTSQPTLTKVGNSVIPALIVEVSDANLNKALRYNSSVNLTSNTAFDGASVNSGSFNSGTATFNSVKLGATNPQAVLYANSGSLTQAVSDTFTVYSLATEPTVAASNLQFSTVGNTSVDLSWTNGNGAKRIVVAKSGAAVNATVLDETTYSANSVFGSGSQIDTGNYVIYSGTGNSVSVTGLSQNQTYHFAVYEFSGTGISTNYLTSSVLTGSQTTLNVSYASLSNAYLVNGTESDSISSIVNNSSPLASTDGAKVFDVFIQDGNGINDFDSLPTLVDSLKFTAGVQNEVSDLSSIIKTVALFDGTTLLAEAIVGQNSLTFKPSSPISIADNGSKTLTVRLSLKNTGIVDNQKIQFSLASSGIYAGTSGSQFGSVSTTETIGSKNKIYVQATKIRFTSQPTLTKVGNSVTPALTVEVTDANLNKALRYNSSVNLNSNTAFDGASVNSGSFNSGTATFSSVKLGATNAQAVLYANSGSLTQAVSDTFTVYDLASEPTIAASNLQFVSVGNTSMKLIWTKGNGSNRIVIAKEGSSTNGVPLDADSYLPNSQFGSGSQIGTGNYVVYTGIDSSVTVTGLSANTEYSFSIYEFNGSGIFLNYASASLNGSKSTISVNYASESSVQLIAASEADEISSLMNNAGPLTSIQGTKVFDLRIKDGSSFLDFDSKPTQVNAVLINQSEGNHVANWSSVIKAAGLFYNSTLISSGNVNSSSITFSIPSGFSVPDDSSRILSVRISLKENGLVDGQAFGFAIDESSFGTTSSDSSSQFSSFASSATSEGSNKIQVAATKLNLTFTSKPTSISVAVSPSPVLTATDINQNLDLDFNGSIGVTSNNSFDGSSTVSKNAVNGSATFDQLIFSSVNFKTALTFSTSGMTDVKSDSFMVFNKSVPLPGEIAINQISSDFGTNHVQLIELVNKTSKYFDLSDLKIRILNATGFALDFNGNLSGILYPNKFWLLSTQTTVKLSETDSVKADATISAVLSSNQQVGLVRNDNTVIDGVSFGTISNNVLTEGSSAAQNGAGTVLKRKTNGFDTNNNSGDFVSVSNNSVSLRNQNSYFFGSGSTIANATYSDLWISGNVSATSGLTISNRIGLESGKLDVSGNELSLGSSAQFLNSKSWVNNKIKRTLSGTGNYGFEIGNISASFTVNVNLTELPTDATNLSASFVSTDAGTASPLPTGILSYWTGGYWTLGTDGNPASGNLDLSIETDSVKSYILENNLANYVILQRTDSESNWIVAGTLTSHSGSVLTATGVSGLGEFTIGEIDPQTVPVEVSGFAIYQDDNNARLVWMTHTETNNNGFEIDKRLKGESYSVWQKVGFVAGKGTTTEKQNYQFSDSKADEACEYRLTQIDLSGKVTVLGTLSFDGIVRKFELVGNYPNPFNPETTVMFRLPSETTVKISVYNNLGQLIRTVKNENMKAGTHEVKINGNDLSSGIYFYEVLTGTNNRAMKKMLLVK